MTTAEQEMRRARTALILDHPFFGALALRLEFRPDTSVDTAAVNGKAVRYNPKWVSGLPPDHLRGVLAHEVMHCAMGHQWRRSGRDFAVWNKACDYAINGIITEAGLSLPDSAMVDARFSDKSAESIYGELHQQPQEQDGGGGKGDGDSSGGKGNVPDPGGCGAVEDGDTGEPDAMTEGDWKVAATQAAKAAAMHAGTLPGCLKRLVEALTDRSLDWRTILADFVQRCARNDYSWRVPNPRYARLGVVLPTLRSEELPCLVIAIDTSGSIDKPALGRFLGAMSDAISAYPTTAHVVCCDTNIHNTAEFRTEDLPIAIEPKGGGGTSFRPVFEWVEQEGIDPAALIYFTDLYCNQYPDQQPDYPVLWVLPKESCREAPWGDTLVMTEKRV